MTISFRLSFTVILAAALASSRTFAQATPSQPELTLSACVARALLKNFDLEISRYNPQLAKESINLAQGGYDPLLTLSGSHGKNSTGAASATSSDLRVGVSQQLYTGTTLSASSKLDRSATNPAYTAVNPAYNADLTLAVRQNLLSGATSPVNQASLRRAEIGLTRANLEFKAQALNVIQDTESAYYNLAFAREQLTVRMLPWPSRFGSMTRLKSAATLESPLISMYYRPTSASPTPAGM